jgi:hypothetical protein
MWVWSMWFGSGGCRERVPGCNSVQGGRMSTHRSPGENIEWLSVRSTKFSSLFTHVRTVCMVVGSSERLSHRRKSLLQLINPSVTINQSFRRDDVLIGVLFALLAGDLLERAFLLLCLAALTRSSVWTALALDLELLASLAGPDALACCAAAVVLGRRVCLGCRGTSVGGCHRAASDSRDSRSSWLFVCLSSSKLVPVLCVRCQVDRNEFSATNRTPHE